MQNATEEGPFRVQLIFYDELGSVQVVPLNGVPNSLSDEIVGGMLRGGHDVASFISGIGIDSIVQTRQLSDLPRPAFELTFHTLPESQIITAIEERFSARYEADVKILEGQPLTEGDGAALSHFECIVLGSTKLRSTEGFCRMREWFKRRPKSAG
jgi:hypothetical protein